MFLLVTAGAGGDIGVLWEEARDAAEYPTVAQDSTPAYKKKK